MKKITSTLALSTLLISGFGAQNSGDQFWLPVKENRVAVNGKRQIVPQKYLSFELNNETLKNKLFSAPHERNTRINESACIISLPLPNGTFERFRVVQSPVMAEELVSAYPNIKTFSVKGIDDPYANGKLDWNDFGFHGMILSVKGDFFIDPYCVGNIKDYISYYTSDFIKATADIIPEAGLITESENQKKPVNSSIGQIGQKSAASVCVGSKLRTYRLAVANTGEYAVAATGQGAPTVSQVYSKIVTTVNRVDGVYEKELAVRLVLVSTQTAVVFTAANSDPFNGNNNANTLINESQTVITSSIGVANFDIGHTFSTGAGGLANLGCVCSNANKAKGITGSPSPVGDPYDIDYVAHEMGHQFGGNHTFNAGTGSCAGNRYGPTSMEPGGGVTIMGYAGICAANDVANSSIPYFHGISYDEIVNFTNSGGGNSCAVTSTNTNNPPAVTGSAIYTVPKSTAFSLTGSAIDPDGDALTYSWEEMDAGAAVGNWNSGNKPFFRSYAPVTSAKRLFPANSVVLNGNYTGTMGEYVPQSAQTLNFRLTARDNKMGGGGVCYANNSIVVDASGPLKVTYPDAPLIIWGISTQQTITWDVNFTDGAPISCDSVRVLISYNGGNAYSVLLASTPNDGAQLITVPTLSATVYTCRIRIEAKGNIFYDIGNNNFTISTDSDVNVGEISRNNPIGLSVWPNPLEKTLNFSVANLSAETPTEVNIVDLIGKVLFTKTYSHQEEIKDALDITQLSNGLYFFKVSHEGKQSVQRILKN